MSRSILVFCLHPASGSFNHALSDALADGARGAGHAVTRLNLSGMTFAPDLGQSGFAKAPPPEPDLEAALAAIAAAEHVVLVSPMWWGGLPAKAKGLFDRAFLPGRAFDPRIRRGGLPKPLFAGRTARLVLTSDTPTLWFRLLYGQGDAPAGRAADPVVLRAEAAGLYPFLARRTQHRRDPGPLAGPRPRHRGGGRLTA